MVVYASTLLLIKIKSALLIVSTNHVFQHGSWKSFEWSCHASTIELHFLNTRYICFCRLVKYLCPFSDQQLCRVIEKLFNISILIIFYALHISKYCQCLIYSKIYEERNKDPFYKVNPPLDFCFTNTQVIKPGLAIAIKSYTTAAQMDSSSGFQILLPVQQKYP